MLGLVIFVQVLVVIQGRKVDTNLPRPIYLSTAASEPELNSWNKVLL